MSTLISSEELARRSRITLAELGAKRRIHFGACLSCMDILAVLHGRILSEYNRKPIILLSKGHGAAGLYAVLYNRGVLGEDLKTTFSSPRSIYSNHTTCHQEFVVAATGALGHGLPVGCGLALGNQLRGNSNQIYVILGDGEMAEGSNWEALAFAAHNKISNITIIIDCNKYQQEGPTDVVLNLEPMSDKLESFGWRVERVNGHCHDELYNRLNIKSSEDKPLAIIADTIKGKGLSFIEGEPSKYLCQIGLEELNSVYSQSGSSE